MDLLLLYKWWSQHWNQINLKCFSITWTKYIWISHLDKVLEYTCISNSQAFRDNWKGKWKEKKLYSLSLFRQSLRRQSAMICYLRSCVQWYVLAASLYILFFTGMCAWVLACEQNHSCLDRVTHFIVILFNTILHWPHWHYSYRYPDIKVHFCISHTCQCPTFINIVFCFTFFSSMSQSEEVKIIKYQINSLKFMTENMKFTYQ